MPTKQPVKTTPPTPVERVEAIQVDVIGSMENAAANALRNIPNIVQDRMLGVAAEMLGFTSQYSRGWEVDHCNNRASKISDVLGTEVNTAVRSAITKIITPELVEKLIADRSKAIISDFENIFIRSFTAAVRKFAEEKAVEAATKFVNDTMKFDPLNASIDIADPESCKTALGAALTEIFVRDNIKDFQGDQK